MHIRSLLSVCLRRPVLALGLVLLTGCAFPVDTLREADTGVTGTQFAPLDITDYVTGDETIDVSYLLVDWEIDRVEFVVDDSLVSVRENFPYRYTLDTGDWPAGPHAVSCRVFEIEPQLGVVNLLGKPSLVLSRTVTFF